MSGKFNTWASAKGRTAIVRFQPNLYSKQSFTWDLMYLQLRLLLARQLCIVDYVYDSYKHTVSRASPS